MTDESRMRLEVFVEKSERLQRSNYFKHIRENGGTTLQLNFTEGHGATITNNFPDEEALEALVLTARMFVQKGDGISFSKLARLIEDEDVSEGWKSQFKHVRGIINSLLEKRIMMIVNGEHPTHREVFDLFVNGLYAHTEEKKYKIVKSWAQDPFLFSYMQFEFMETLTNLIRIVDYLATISTLELQGLPVRNPGGE